MAKDSPPFCLDVLNRYKCQLCSFKTDFKIHFYHHIRAFHEEKQIYSDLQQVYEVSECRCCNFSTHSALVFVRHVNSCNRMRNFSNQKDEHVGAKKNDKWLKCGQCSFKTDMKFCFRNHMWLIHRKHVLICNEKMLSLLKPKSSLTISDMSNKSKVKRSELSQIICKKISPSKSPPPPCEYSQNDQQMDFECFIVPQTYKCRHCLFEHGMKVVVKNHTSIYHERKNVGSLSKPLLGFCKCEYCDFVSYTSIVMLKHTWFKCTQRPLGQQPSNKLLKYACDELKYKCPRCAYQTKHRFLLKKHMKLGNHLACKFCPYTSNYKRQLRDHVLMKHNHSVLELMVQDKSPIASPDFTKSIRHKCLRCNFQTKSEDDLTRHVTMLDHEAIEQSGCKLRSDTCENNHESRDHILVKQSYPVQYSLESQKILKSESVDVREVTSHKCSQCHYQTKIRSILDVHMKLKHDESSDKLYSDICEYKHQLRDSVFIKRTYSKLRPLEEESKVGLLTCPRCNFKTKYRSFLDRHMLKYDHETIKQFKCKLCSFKCEHNHQLRDHVLIKHTVCPV